jgi:hypothetical protein
MQAIPRRVSATQQTALPRFGRVRDSNHVTLFGCRPGELCQLFGGNSNIKSFWALALPVGWFSATQIMAESDSKPFDAKEWILEAETEYRFELDPGTSLAIRVSSRRNTLFEVFRDDRLLFCHSSSLERLKYSVLNSRKARPICSARSARRPSSLGKVVPSR